ncbi:hypothetical protein [Paenibacillus donghaensis]|uniref:hypothetical protein n=1 Tax=Paenibacillus donghaensis TaxID=414771 RepID=UPI0012FD6521|nr:hypothetical protein [Paenibacillus donghaensis]
MSSSSSRRSKLSYNESVLYWQKVQRFFPEEIRLTADRLPSEEWWAWERGDIHIDRLPVAGATLQNYSVAWCRRQPLDYTIWLEDGGNYLLKGDPAGTARLI